MGLFYGEYIVSGSRTEVLASLREAVDRQGWQIFEQSPGSIFGYVDTGRMVVSRRRAYASAEDSARGVRIRLAVWGTRAGARHLIGDMPYFLRLADGASSGPRAKAFLSDSGFAGHLRRSKPAWVRLLYLGYLLTILIALGTLVAVLVASDARGGAQLLYLLPLGGLVLLGAAWQILIDLVPRIALGIKSRKGIGSTLLASALVIVAWVVALLVLRDGGFASLRFWR